MRRRRILGSAVVLLGVLAAVTAAAAPPPGAAEGFLQGNKLYQAGDYAGAAKAYESVLAEGVTAPGLEYNLGNAYLKSGDVGRAILHYRRALKLDPTFESAQTNINYARSLTQDVKPENPGAGHWAWVSRLRLGPSVAAFLLFAAVTAFALVAALRLTVWRSRGAAAVLQAVLGGLAVLLVAALVFEWSQLEGAREGVVVAQNIEVRSGPGDQYTVSFRLHPGTEVDILRQTAGWREVRVSDRLQGWMPEDAVAPI
jgi:tetratricopeptide (TPR) repeat protein